MSALNRFLKSAGLKTTSITRRSKHALNDAARSFRLEPMEPRLLLDATPFVFAIGPDQPNVTVAVADVSGVATVQFTNNETDGVLASRALSDTSEIVVTGSDQDDVLTIDVGDDGALAAIPIAFDGAAGIDTILVAGGSFDLVTYNALGTDSGEVVLGSGATASISYTGLENVLDITDADSRLFANATASPQETRLADDGEFNGFTLIDSNETGGFTAIFFAEPANGLSIQAGAAGDHIIIGEFESEFGASITIAGGAGADTLEGPALDGVWTITGPDAGTLNDSVSFSGIENLQGAADTDDTFIFETAGSISGLVDGGEGGVDNIIIRSATDTAIVVPDGSGVGAFDGRTISYSGIEPFVDTTDAATTWINGTILADDVVLEADPIDPTGLQIRISGARFLLKGSLTDRLTFAGPTDALILDLRDGDDLLTWSLAGSASVPKALVGGGIGMDRLAGPDTANTWRITGADGGTLNDTIEFAGFENMAGGSAVDTFTITVDGRVTGAIDGGAGADELKREEASSLWTIMAAGAGRITDSITSETVAGFAGIEKLTGSADEEDTFYFETGGSVTGLVDGGAGGVDQLIIVGATATVLVLPGLSGLAVFDGRMISYAGLEPVVDAADPSNVTIQATVLDDDLTLEGDSSQPGDRHSVQLRTANYKFLDSAMVVDHIVFSTTGALSLHLRQGDDVLTLGAFNIGFESTVSIDGGADKDELAGSNSQNAWLLDGPDSGLLNSRFEFDSIENLRGGTGRDIFTVAGEGTLSGTLDGGDGNDDLRGPSQAVAWNVSAEDSGELTDQLTGGTLLQFANIENLIGNADNVDSFIISEGGKVTGSIEGGDGGWDSLVIRGDHDTVVEPGILFGSVFFDTVTINGVTITYRGLEPFVDDSIPADVVINGTGVNDDLTLAPDPDNAGQMRVSGSSGLLFYKDGTFSEGISFANPTIGLSINLRFGDDTLTVAGVTTGFNAPISITGGFGLDKVIVSDDLFLPGQNLTINAESITVNDGVTISTRQIGGSQDPADHLDAASTGNSGNITLNAESSGLLFRALATALFPSLSEPTGVTIGVGAALLAQVDPDHLGVFTPGDITLTARDENGLGLPGFLLSGILSGIYKNQAEVTMEESAILRGGNVSVFAGAKFSPQPDFLDGQLFDSLAPYSLQETKVGELLGKIPAKVGTVVGLGSKPLTKFLVKKVTGMESLPLQLLGKIAEATVDVGSKVEITATGHVTMEANGVADATTKVENPLFSVSLSVAHATAEVRIGDDAKVTAVGNVNAVANASATAKSESSTTKNKTANPNVAENLSAKTFSLAVSESQTTAHVTVSETAEVHAGGSVNIAANGNSENEAGAKFTIYLDGTFGIAAGIGLATSDIRATVNGTVTSDAAAGPALSLSNIDEDKDTIDLGFQHGLATGQALIYHADESTSIDKLSDGKTYYVIADPGSTRIKLAAELGDAIKGKAIDLKSPTGTPSAASLERTIDGVSVVANLVSSDKATAEGGIGDKPSTFIKEKLGKLAGSGVVKKIVGKLPTEFFEKKRQELESGALTPSGASSKPSDYSIAGAIAFSRTDHNVNAEVTATGVVKSRGDIEIRASQTEKVQTSAETSIEAEKAANAKKKKSGSVSLSIGLYNSKVHALAGDGATLDASDNIVVDSSVLYPFLTEPTELFSKADFTTVEGIKKLLDGKLGLQDKLLNSWAVSSANADELAISGSVNWIVFTNVSDAKIDANAKINQDVLYQNHAQAVSVEATTEMQLVNMTGVFDFEIDLTKLKDLFLGKDKLAKKLADLNPLGPGFESDGKGFGGALFVMVVDNHTTATIGENALVHTGTSGALNVTTESTIFDLAMVQSGGKGGEFGAAGSFSFIKDDGVTWSHIESGAQIDGGAVTLEATDNANHWNAVGGFMKGEARGVGVSASINLIGRDTAAFIGTEEGQDAGSGTSIHSSGDVTLNATGTGNIHTFALAASVVSNKPMKGSDTDPLDGVSLPILFGEAEPEKEPSKTGLAVSASISWNTVNDQTRAYINDTGTITAGDVSLTAHNDRGIVSASGAAAIAKTKGSETSTALAGAFSLNQLKIDTLAFINAATIDIVGSGQVALTAIRDGLLFSFSGGGAGAPAKNGTGGMGSVSINRILNTTMATMDGVTLHTSGGVELHASDESNIIAIAGGGAYGESKGVGGAIAINQIAGMTEAAVLGNLRRSTIGTEDAPAGNISLTATNDNSIQAVALSVGASKGGGLAVTLGINLITTDPVSGIENAVTATIQGTDIHSEGDLSLLASDNSTLEAVGGALGVGKDKYGFGAALGWNEVDDDVSATIEDATVTTSGFVHLTARVSDGGPLLEGKIVAASVGAAGSKETAIGGALSINVIHDTVDARISGGATVTAGADVILTAKDSSSLKALTGGIAISTKSGAVGIAIGVNDISNTITAAIDNATVTSSLASVELGARSDAKTGAITAGGAGADKFALGGSVAINLLRNTIDAHVTNGATVTALGLVSISAVDSAAISGFTGGLAFAKTTGIGAALSTNDILDTTTAYIDNATVMSLAGDVDLHAQSGASILAITAGGGGAQSFALGGSITVNIVRNQTKAYVSGSSDVEAAGDIHIRATEQRANDESLELEPGHGFVTGDAVIYTNGGGASIGGLTDGETYYVIVDAFDPGQIRLAPSHDDAMAGVAVEIDPATASGAEHQLTKTITFDPATAIDEAAAEDAIDLGPDHGLYDGAAVQYDNGGGADIGGLESGRTYYVIEDTDNPDRIRLAATREDASSGMAIDIDPGVATGSAHSLVRNVTFDPARTTSTTHVVGIAGGIAGSTKNAVGAALATNDIANQTKAYIDSSTVASLSADIEIEASSETKISALTIGGSGAGTFAAGGAIAVNLTLNTIDAHISGSLDPDPLDNDVLGVHAAGSISLTATDNSAIDGGSGGIAGAGQTAIGAALMTNDIVNTTTAYIDGSTATAERFNLNADSEATIRSIAVGGSAAGNFALGGSLSINIVANTIDAHISGGSEITSIGDVALSAVDNTTIFAGAGGLAFAGSTAIGAALASNDTANTTTAYIEGSTVDVSAGSVIIESDSAVDIKSATVSGGGAGSTSINGSIAVHVTHNETSAYIGPDSHVTADGNVIVSAADDIAMLVGAGNLGGAGSTAVGVSSSTVITNNTTEAYVAGGATVSALGNQGAAAVFTGKKGAAGAAIGGLRDGVTYFVIVDENDPSKIRLAGSANDAAAGIAIDLDPSAATGVSHRLAPLDTSSGPAAIFDPSTDADGADDSIVLGAGHGFATGDAVVYGTPKGDRLTENIRGLSVTAVSFESVVAIAAGGQGAGSIGGAGSVTVNKLNETTHSYIGAGALINSGGNGGANAGQSVNVRASDETSLFSLAGAGAIGGSAGIGAGVDVGVITKRTEAGIDDTAIVNAMNDVTVRARSDEDIRSLTAALGGGGSAGIAGATGVYVMDLTTLASIGQEDGVGATVTAGDSVLVSAEDRTELDLIGGTITGGGSASGGASAAVPVVNKTTKAFIGPHSTVTALGNGDGVLAYTGLFDITFETEQFELGEVPAPLFFAKNGIMLDVTGDGVPDLNDPQLTRRRVSTPLTTTVKGVAVTAINRDDIEAIGASGGGSGALSVAIGGTVNVITAETLAFIADDARVNADNTGAGDEQSVLVAAGNDYAHTGMALVGAGSGTVALTPAADVTVVNNTTEAFIDDGADVHALGNIAVVANASEDILSISAGIAVSGVASVGGAVSVIVINNKTYAHIGEDPAEGQAVASVMAGGSILVSAGDATDIDLIAGSLGVGIGGGAGGASVAVTVIHKDTQGFIGAGATIDAKGAGAALSGLYDGGVDETGFSTGGDLHGLAVQAASFEDLVSVAAAGGGGFYAGIAGGVSSAVIDSDTKAFIGVNAQVNQDPDGADALQDVHVTAVNGAKALGVTGGLGIGIAGIGGAVDVGVIRNDTAAFIGDGASVRAAHDVDVNALSVKTVNTVAVAAGGGIVGAVGAVSVWTIGSEFDSNYMTDDDSHDALSTNSGTYPTVQSFIDSMAGGKIAGGGYTSILKGHSNPTFDPATAVDSAEDTIDLGPNHGLHQGDAVVYRNGGGADIDGLEDGEIYYVILDTDNPGRIRLALSHHDALNGVAIDLDASTATGAAHKLEPFTGSATRDAGESIDESAPDGEVGGATSVTDPSSGVTAYLAPGATVVAGGNVAIHAEEFLAYKGQTGSIAIGVGGIGGSVTIAHIQSNTDAHIGNGASITGGGAGTFITIEALLTENIAGSAFAGQAGAIAAGAQVVVINDNSTQMAYIADSAVIENAGIVTVFAGANRTITANATGGGVGGAALGAAVAVVNVHGETKAFIDDATIGRNVDDPSDLLATVGALIVTADAVITAEAHTIAVSAGLGGGAANGSVAITTVDPEVSAYIGDGADVLVLTDVVVEARLEADANAEALGISVDGNGAVGASVAIASLLPQIAAAIIGNATVAAGHDITLRSSTNTDRDGKKLKKGTRATATSGSGALLAGAAGAFATATNSPDLETSIGSGSTVSAGHDILMVATANNLIPARMVTDPLHPSQQIEIGGAQASGAGLGAIGVGVSVSTADIGGSVKTHIDGATVNAGHDIAMGSESIADATAKAWAVSGGIAGGSGNKTTVHIDSTIDTMLGAGANITAGGDVRLGSGSEGNIEAEARGLSVGGAAIGVSLVDAAMTPHITTSIAPAVIVTAGGSVSLASLHNHGAASPLDKGAHATGNSSGGGILSGNGADVNASSSAVAETAIGSGAMITAGEDVALVSRAFNEANANSTGTTIGVVGIGAILADAKANGSTSAHIDNGTTITAGRDVTLHSKAVGEGVATAKAAGGGLASGNGADAKATVSPSSSALVGALAGVFAGNDVRIAAQAETHSTATATGTTTGGISVGASFATAETHPMVSAGVGDGAVIQAGHSITISALYNIADDGSGINTVRATSTGSAGSLLAGILAGADAKTVADVHADAGIGAGAELDITGNLDDTSVTIVSRAYNSVHADATGNSGGLFTGNAGASGTRSTASVTTHADTHIGDGAAIGGNLLLQGHLQNVVVSSTATSIVNGTATGASGKDIAGAISNLFNGQIDVPSILSGGGTVIDFDIDNAANTAIGALAEILAGGQISITADSRVEVHANSNMTSGGVAHADSAVLADVFVDLDSTVAAGDGSRIDGNVVLLGAHNQLDGDVTTTATANVSLGVADAAATSRFNVGSVADPSQALVTLGDDTHVSGRDGLSIEALNDQAGDNLISQATAKSFGAALTGDAIAEANGTLQIRSTVTSGDGSTLSSGGLTVNADSTIGIDRLADSDAASFVTVFVKEARTVVRKITRWLPWPLNKIVETITETIFVLVPHVTAVGGESAKSTGSGVQSGDTVNLHGDIYSVGSQNALLIIHKDPNDPDNIIVDPSSTLGVELVDVDGDGISDISVGALVSDSSGNISITAPKGDIIGDARVHINTLVNDLHIVNETDRNLVLHRLDMLGGNDDDPDLNFQSDNGQEYEVVSEVSSTSRNIENLGSGDIIFAETFSNVTAALDVYNQGGNIRTANADVYLETGDAGHLSLTADNGGIGSADLPFRVRLLRGKLLPDGAVSTMAAELMAHAEGDIFLDVTGVNNTFTEFDPTEIVDGIALDVSAGAGNIHITTHEGEIIDQITEETTDEDGQPVTRETQATRASYAVYEFRNVTATSGNVFIDVTGDLDAGLIDAPTGTTSILATGSILHANNVFVGEPVGPNVGGGNVLLTAGVAIGDPDAPLKTHAGKLEANAPAGLWIVNSGPLTLGGITGGPALQSDGPIVVGATSPVTVIADVLSMTDIVLTSGDSAGPGDDLIVTNGATIRSTGGSITLAAGDNFILDAGSAVIAAGAIHIIVDAGDADPGVGGIMVINGSLVGHPLTLGGSSGDDVIVITHVDAGVPLDISTGDGDDTIIVGSHATATSNTGGTLATILDLLTIDGGAGFDRLLVDNSGETTDTVGSVNADKLTGLGLVTPITFQNLDAIVVGLGSGNDTFLIDNSDVLVMLNLGAGDDRVIARALTHGVVVDLGAGDDTVVVGSHATSTSNTGGTLATILASLTIDGGATGYDRLLVDDSGETQDSIGALNAGELTGLGLGGPITFQNVDAVLLDLGSGNDTFLVNNAGAFVTLNTHGGDDHVNVGLVPPGLFVDLGAGDDTIVVGPQAGATPHAGGLPATTLDALTIEGGSGFDHLLVDDSDETADLTGGVSPGTVTGLGFVKPITFQNVETLRVDLGSGNDTFFVDNPDVPVTLNLHDGDDRVYVGAINRKLIVDLGAGNDTITVGSRATSTPDTGGTLATILDVLTVDGGPGYDRLLADDSGETTDSSGSVEGGQLSGLGLVTPILFENIDSLVVDLGSGDDMFFVGNADAVVTLNTHDGKDRVTVGAMTRGLIVDLGGDNDKLTTSDQTTGDITAYGGDGNDHIEGGRGNDALFGGAGNDKLEGGEGNDILEGGEGNDGLSGGSGDDILIGGDGHDHLFGDSGHNLLIGGRTLYDNDLDALRAIQAEWTRTDIQISQRIQNLTFGGGRNGSIVLTSFTILDDNSHDTLHGDLLMDWMFIADEQPGKKKSESGIRIDWDSSAGIPASLPPVQNDPKPKQAAGKK